MQSLENNLIIKESINLVQPFNLLGNLEDCDEEPIGGILKNGQLSWNAIGTNLNVHCLKTGYKIASYSFANNYSNSLVTCVTEIQLPHLNSCILAVGVQTLSGSLIYLFSVQGSRILQCIGLPDKISCCIFFTKNLCQKTLLHYFDGCLVIGTIEGKIILIDLYMKLFKEAFCVSQKFNHIEPISCHILFANSSVDQLYYIHKQTKKENICFGIQLEVLSKAVPVLSLLYLSPLLTLAAGLDDGKLIMYDLTDLQAFHLAYPPEENSSLTKLAYIEPVDDPRACVYIWAFHRGQQYAISVMHSLKFEQKISKEDYYYYQNFQACSVQLTMPMFSKESIPISCQSITKLNNHEDEVITLCLLSWMSADKLIHIILFDLNQWYKEQMPHVGDWREMPSYIASFPLGTGNPIDICIDNNSIATFNSIQRPEEHFYPNSLCFDCLLLNQGNCIRLHWQGLQNKALEMLTTGGSKAILEPNVYYQGILNANLVPLFLDYNVENNLALEIKREVLLSLALEYNCIGLLKQCAFVWADGSHQGKYPNEGLSLSTLTEWIWNRSNCIKESCNDLCIPLFDYSGRRIDHRSQKILSHCARQLKLLADLLEMIINSCQRYIPNEVLNMLKTQENSIRMSSDYQEVLQWLLNMGLLPESNWNSTTYNSHDSERLSVPYQYQILRNYCNMQRKKFYNINKKLINLPTGNCKVLYIDAFIENECNPKILHTHWKNNKGNGLYPPDSLQTMLRTLLVPNVPIEHKYILFVYLFLDLSMILNEERYHDIVNNLIKFPAVFKLNPVIIKTTQAFWNLDHGQLETALDELVSPLSQNRHMTQWQQELLIEALLVNESPHLALRALRAPGSPISSYLEMKTLLSNDLIAEAYQLQRIKGGGKLLNDFFEGCVAHNKWRALLELALTEKEGQLLSKYLLKSKTITGENVHFVYLLQRSKYIEALTLIDNLQRRKITNNIGNNNKIDLQTPNLVLSAFNSTMSPTTRYLSNTYYKLREKIQTKRSNNLIDPLSSTLIREKISIVGGIYQKSLASVEDVSDVFGRHDNLINLNYLTTNDDTVPFLRNPHFDLFPNYSNDNIVYPKIIDGSKKRRLEQDSSEFDDQYFEKDVYASPLKRSRTELSQTHKSKESLKATLLTNFKDKNKRKNLPTIRSSHSSVSDKSFASSSFMLNTPIVRTSTMYSNDANVRPNFQELTQQGILKVKNMVRASSMTSMSSRRSASPNLLTIRKSAEPEEKSLRFNLNEMENNSLTSIAEHDEDNLSEKSVEKTEFHDNKNISDSKSDASMTEIFNSSASSNDKTKSFLGAKPRASLRSVDSKNLSAISDEFYSPKSSKENSNVIVAATAVNQPLTTNVELKIEEEIILADAEKPALIISKYKSVENIKEKLELEVPGSPIRRSQRIQSRRALSEEPQMKSSTPISSPLVTIIRNTSKVKSANNLSRISMETQATVPSERIILPDVIEETEEPQPKEHFTDNSKIKDNVELQAQPENLEDAFSHDLNNSSSGLSIHIMETFNSPIVESKESELNNTEIENDIYTNEEVTDEFKDVISDEDDEIVDDNETQESVNISKSPEVEYDGNKPEPINNDYCESQTFNFNTDESEEEAENEEADDEEEEDEEEIDEDLEEKAEENSIISSNSSYSSNTNVSYSIHDEDASSNIINILSSSESDSSNFIDLPVEEEKNAEMPVEDEPPSVPIEEVQNISDTSDRIYHNLDTAFTDDFMADEGNPDNEEDFLTYSTYVEDNEIPTENINITTVCEDNNSKNHDNETLNTALYMNSSEPELNQGMLSVVEVYGEDENLSNDTDKMVYIVEYPDSDTLNTAVYEETYIQESDKNELIEQEQSDLLQKTEHDNDDVLETNIDLMETHASEIDDEQIPDDTTGIVEEVEERMETDLNKNIDGTLLETIETTEQTVMISEETDISVSTEIEEILNTAVDPLVAETTEDKAQEVPLDLSGSASESMTLNVSGSTNEDDSSIQINNSNMSSENNESSNPMQSVSIEIETKPDQIIHKTTDHIKSNPVVVLKRTIRSKSVNSSDQPSDLSFSKDIIQTSSHRELRGSSVPKMGKTKGSTPPIRGRRSSTDSPSSASKIQTRRQSLLAKIDEEQQVADELKMTKTPRKLRQSNESLEKADKSLLVTPKRTRRSSVSAMEVLSTPEMRTPISLRLTPARKRKLMETSSEEIVEEELTVPLEPNIIVLDDVTTYKPKKRGRKPSNSSSIADDKSLKSSPDMDNKSNASSIKSSRSTASAQTKRRQKTALPKVDEDDADIVETPDHDSSFQKYSTSRRLTRSQQSVIEKSKKLNEKYKAASAASKLEKQRNDAAAADTEEEEDDDNSVENDKEDNASEISDKSLISKKSKASKAPSKSKSVRTPSKAKRTSEFGDTVSVASSDKSSRSRRSVSKLGTPSKGKKLTQIPEEHSDSEAEDDENQTKSETSSKKRGRPRKN